MTLTAPAGGALKLYLIEFILNCLVALHFPRLQHDVAYTTALRHIHSFSTVMDGTRLLRTRQDVYHLPFKYLESSLRLHEILLRAVSSAECAASFC